MVDNNSY